MKKYARQTKYCNQCKPKTRNEYADSRALYVQRQHEKAERRQRINPRLVMTDPESFFNEQNETT